MLAGTRDCRRRGIPSKLARLQGWGGRLLPRQAHFGGHAMDNLLHDVARQAPTRGCYGMGREPADGPSGTAGQPLGQVTASTSITRAVWALFQAW